MSSVVCHPLDTLEEVYAFAGAPPPWGSEANSRSRRSRAVRNSSLFERGYACHVPSLSSSEPSSADLSEHLPKTLVCHDMKNGYHDDRFHKQCIVLTISTYAFINGSDDHSAYLFYHWSAIDIFVYFSHHFITIPPLCWINVAHKHGVQILGTMITEWSDGFKICEQFLKTEIEYRKFANHLIFIAKHFKLDGWLLNIENEINKIQNLIGFVQYLSDKIHEEIPGSVIIWYDSVTIDGQLKWQNSLNEMNRVFFDNCDGIFTNYTWNVSHLNSSLINAGSRKHDVFVGVDVWGRNFMGGGCFNTCLAMKEIYACGLSVAIFAPAWTHEGIKAEEINYISNTGNLQSCNSENEYSVFSTQYNFALENEKKCMTRCYFLMRENVFWNQIWPYLNTRGPTELPFRTFFCIGSGETKRVNGDVIQSKPWFNLREQQYQLSFPLCPNNTFIKKVTETSNTENEKKKDANEYTIIYPNLEENSCISHYTKDSFHGGNCIKINPLSVVDCNEIVGQHISRLFLCDFKCIYNFVLFCIVKCLENNDQDLDLLLSMKNNITNKQFCVNLCIATPLNIKPNLKSFHIKPVDFKNEVNQALKDNLKRDFPSHYISTIPNGWKIKYFYVNIPDSSITNISCKLVKDNGAILLGGLGIVKDIQPY